MASVIPFVDSSPWFGVYLIVSWWLAVVGIMASLWQPQSAYEATNRSKLRWFLIELIGVIPYIGVFTWFAFRFFVREKLKANGGRLGFWQHTEEEKAEKEAKRAAEKKRRAEEAKRAAAEEQERLRNAPPAPPPPGTDGIRPSLTPRKEKSLATFVRGAAQRPVPDAVVQT